MNEQIVLSKKKSGLLSPIGYRRIDITSNATDIFRQCSPFFLGPIPLYEGLVSKNMENAWQFSKVYRVHTDEHGNPTPEHFEWASAGFNCYFAQAHPMGKLPALYHLWNGKKLNYEEAKRTIALPCYCNAVVKTEAYAQLKAMYDAGQKICLIDYDGFDYAAAGMTEDDLIASDVTLGQSFMLKWVLEGRWENYTMK